MELDHIAVAARRIEDVLPDWKRLGFSAVSTEEVPGQGVKVAFLELGSGAHIELLEPLGPASPIQGFLEKRGPGLHHVAFKVDAIDERMSALKGSGAALLNDTARAGSRGTRVCFLQPQSCGGVLVELVEHPAERLDPRD